MDDMHLGALELTLTAENWSAGVTVRSAIDGRIVNAGAKLYRKFNNKHLESLASEAVGEDGVYLLVRTCQSNIHVAQAARTRAFSTASFSRSTRQVDRRSRDTSAQEFADRASSKARRLVLEKLASFYTLARPGDFRVRAGGAKGDQRARVASTAVMADHVLVWKHLWRRFDVHDPASRSRRSR